MLMRLFWTLCNLSWTQTGLKHVKRGSLRLENSSKANFLALGLRFVGCTACKWLKGIFRGRNRRKNYSSRRGDTMLCRAA